MTVDNDYVFIGDIKYRMSVLIGLSRDCPVGEIKPEEFESKVEALNFVSIPANSEHAITSSQMPLVIKRDGKYHVISNLTKVVSLTEEGKIVKARIISKHTLKKALYDKPVIEYTPPVETKKKFRRDDSQAKHHTRPETSFKKSRKPASV